MSILLIGPERSLGRAIVDLLIDEGDEVRVLTDQPGDASFWKERRAHVAVGALDDEDLIERAAQACRSAVTGSSTDMTAVVAGLRAAAVGRLIVLAPSVKEARSLEGSLAEIDHVILTTRRKGLLGKSVSHEDLATAVSAADDLAEVHVKVVELGDPEGWEALRLEPR